MSSTLTFAGSSVKDNELITPDTKNYVHLFIARPPNKMN